MGIVETTQSVLLFLVLCLIGGGIGLALGLTVNINFPKHSGLVVFVILPCSALFYVMFFYNPTRW